MKGEMNMAKFFVTGDTHADIDIKKLHRTGRTIMNKLTPEDYLFICGDFGGVWDGSAEDDKILDWYARQPYTICFVDGNHENFNLLNSYPIEEWCGGKIHRIRPNLIHLMRGQYYTIEGKTFLTMGGALSSDRHLRTENVDWWAGERPSNEDVETLHNTLATHDSVDYIITHAAPTTVLPHLSPYYDSDVVTDLLDHIYYNIDFKYWYFGHYHCNMYVKQKLACLYDTVIEMEGQE
jgi:hypothetical protein